MKIYRYHTRECHVYILRLHENGMCETIENGDYPGGGAVLLPGSIYKPSEIGFTGKSNFFWTEDTEYANKLKVKKALGLSDPKKKTR